MSKDKLNCYGDKFTPAGPIGHGAEIASIREDDLDKQALAKAKQLNKNSVVFDLGCGEGNMALKFYGLGARAYAFDINPMERLKRLSELKQFSEELIVQGDITRHRWSDFPHPDIVYSQRTLHYFRYHTTIQMLTELVDPSRGCWLFLSFSGLHSELGWGYPKNEIEHRFAPLSDKMARKHEILHPVCLYEIKDIHTLAFDLDVQIEKVWQSEFGNIKAILKKQPSL